MGTDSRKPWGRWDILLAEGYTIMQRERCTQCGYPVWICHNDSDLDQIGIRVLEDTCFVKREVETVDEQKSKGKGKNYAPPKGTVARPEYFSWNKTPFDLSMRTRYYERLAATAKLKAEAAAR